MRVGSLPPRSPQSMVGVIVGLSGSTAFCLNGNIMTNVPLSLGSTMWQFVESQMFEYVVVDQLHRNSLLFF